MATTSTLNPPSTAPIAQHRDDAPRWQFHVAVQRVTALALVLLTVLVAALRPDEAVFRLPHVLVIVASLLVVSLAAIAGVFHR